MVTATEPMVRVVSVKCQECGFDYSEESVPNWSWVDPQGYSVEFVRVRSTQLHRCNAGCGNPALMLFATEPVR